MRILAWLGLLVLISGSIAGLWWLAIVQDETEPDVAEPAVTFTAQNETEPFDVIIVQDSPAERRVLQCQKEFVCQPQLPPASLDHDAVFDGQRWYRYEEKSDPSGPARLALVRRPSDPAALAETIVEETALVRPRGLIASPAAEKIAYWLDNIDTPAQQLTELWVYNSQRGSTGIVAEKVSRQSVATAPRWNKSGTHLWFFNDQQKLVVIADAPLAPPAEYSLPIDPQKILPGQIDVSAPGGELAFVTEASSAILQRRTSTLTVTEAENVVNQVTITGTIPYLQWLSDGSLIYAVQDALGTSFWRFAAAKHTFIARHDQLMLTGHSDLSQNFLLFATRPKSGQLAVHALNIPAGQIHAVGTLAERAGQMHIVRAEHRPAADAGLVAGITAPLSDEELIAFVEKNLPAIIGLPAADAGHARATKLLMTSQENTLFVEYLIAAAPGRLLLTVRDAQHTEWSIRARYRPIGAEWQRETPGSAGDPAVTRWYEWESGVNQWILKSNRPA